MNQKHDTDGPYASPLISTNAESEGGTPRAWLRGNVSGIATLFLSVLSAYGYLVYSNLAERQQLIDTGMPPEMAAEMGLGYGTGDIPAFAFWSFGISTLILFYVAWTTKRTFRRPIPIRIAYFLGVPFIAFAWTLFVASALGPWMGAFSFPVFPCWLIGACGGAILSVVVRPTRIAMAHTT